MNKRAVAATNEDRRRSSFFFRIRVTLGTALVGAYIAGGVQYVITVPVWLQYAWVASIAVLGLYWGFWPEKERLADPAPAVSTEPFTHIDEYGQFVRDMWVGGEMRASDLRQLLVMTAGLGGESGEVQDIIKKHVRDGVLDREHLRKELGDVAYYWAALCGAYGFLPSEVLGANRVKLLDRAARGVLQGTGDDR